ncbi:ABC transporter permease [Mycolicibacterium sp. YH-1]|uniref:ABC transporter permease n=1 Tax=Mycolicibacterium sp. YH-1 TaxID=2908837 RepID=UPI001F4C1BE2|nr:ABC transporter permease [Mycolicibacterium sp. YH-1]UNB54457.1 ABC transporter permease [Mycolicibacterium sp. YH-1]
MALPAWTWLTAFFVMPVGIVVWYSFGYKPGIFATHSNDRLSLDRYLEALSPTFLTTFINTLWIGVAGTAICLIAGLPIAYWMAVKLSPGRRGIVLGLVMIPFWTNFLVRTLGWQIILAPDGFVSAALQKVGLLAEHLDILYTRPAVLIGVVYNYLPLMILPLFIAFDRVAPALREASKDLGANRWSTFTQVTLPLARPGVIAGIVLVFIPLMGDYVTATILGGARGNMIGQLVAAQFQGAQNWALGSAMAVLLIVTISATAALGAVAIWLTSAVLRSRKRIQLGPAAT